MPLSRFFADDIRALRQDPAALVAGSEREKVARLGERAARSILPVLIENEPGSGAHALARAIHEHGERKSRLFVRLQADDPTLREESQETVLARCMKEAHGGTLFIESVERLTNEAQNRLLDLLHAHDAPSRNPKRLDVRLIAAAGFDLAEQVRTGFFRDSLFYRLQALPIALRPLRAQPDAIVEWAHLFAERFAADEGRRIRGLSADAKALLLRYAWPGNLRQLENAVYRAVVLAEGTFLTPAEFPQIAAHVEGFRVEIPPVPALRTLAPVRASAPAPQSHPHALSLMREDGEMLTLAELEERAIRFALVHYQGHMSAISRHLGIGRSTLYRKLKELGLNDEAA